MKTSTHTPLRRHAALAVLVALLTVPALGQELNYTAFINRVMEHNPAYAAAKLDLSMSQADLSVAKKFTDPTLSAEYGNNSDWDIAMGTPFSFGLEKSVSFGKRSALHRCPAGTRPHRHRAAERPEHGIALP